MKKVYKNQQGEAAMLELYDRQLKALGAAYDDLFAETRFGKAHVVRLGDPGGKPLLLFHGGNSTTPYYLSGFKALFEHFRIYAVDTAGHPGKSSRTVVSHKSMEYGEWASDVITGLGFQKMSCVGGSYGGGILVKLMCVDPGKIEKAVLIVPSGISNVSAFSVLIKMGIPMIAYILSKNEKRLKKAILPMAVDEKNIDAGTYEMAEHSFKYAAVKAGMPSNAKIREFKEFTAPVLLIAAELDCLFPGEKVIEKAKKMIPNLTAYLLKGQGHLCSLPAEVMDMVKSFLEEAPENLT